MTQILLVFIGGGLGAVIRHLTGMGFLKALGPGFPYATLFINVSGSALMGLLIGILAQTGLSDSNWRIFLATGVLGGYTTFSTFSLDALTLYERGDLMGALLYVAASMVLSLIAIVLAIYLARNVAWSI